MGCLATQMLIMLICLNQRVHNIRPANARIPGHGNDHSTFNNDQYD